MMQPFRKDFLEQVAIEKYLTDDQREVFVATYENPEASQEDLADGLISASTGKVLSSNAFRTRMTGVYKAFGIEGQGSNKKRRLHTQLLEIYRKQQGRDSDDPILDRGIDDFVERVRRQVEPDIVQRCGTMRVLDMAQPVGLGEIYTDVNILAKVSRTSRKDLAQIQEMVELDLENFERFSFGEIAKERVAGLEVVKEHRKLMIWGKPGAGKTTFLKHLAMSCIRGELFPELVPFFVTLKSFAEEDGQPNLFTYLQAQAEMHGVEPERLKEIINAGRAMILLDGLDEVRQEDSRRVIKGIQNFADLWRDNFFSITCRIAAKEYTFQGGFTEVEVADFDKEQIACFVTNWFRCKGEEKKAEEFIKALEKQKPIQELASSPLLLTLLCLVFEENFQFPQNRAELYKDGLDILLKKWDGKRAIQRDEIYKNLTVKRREQMLSEIAFKTFEKGEYFFKQNRVENLILEFIQNLPDAKSDPEALRLDSETVLKAIEAQHGILVERVKGIYSFSHLTFQEYLAAKYLANQSNCDQVIQENFPKERWKEVHLIAFELIEEITFLSKLSIILKKHIDNSINPTCDCFLVWLKTKEGGLNFDLLEFLETSHWSGFLFTENTSLLTRALYFYFERRVDWYGHQAAINRFVRKKFQKSMSDYVDFYVNDIFINQSFRPEVPLEFYLYQWLPLTLRDQLFVFTYTNSLLEDAGESEFQIDKELFSMFLDGMPHSNKSHYFHEIWEAFWNEKDKITSTQDWIKEKSESWYALLRHTMISHCDIAREWEWTDEQKKSLNNYWGCNRFLLRCLQFAYIRRDVREWIENTMFLPMSEIEKMPPPEV